MKLNKFGVYSQGLALPYNSFEEDGIKLPTEINVDMTDKLGVKYIEQEDNVRKEKVDKVQCYINANKKKKIFKNEKVKNFFLTNKFGRKIIEMVINSNKKKRGERSFPTGRFEGVSKTDQTRCENMPWVQGFKIDNTNININAEYDIVLGDLNIRPGVYYQSVHNNDKPYLDRDADGNYTSGYLNDHIRINSFAGSLRVDYKMLDEKLRLIGGLRAEKFSVSDYIYMPVQLVASYNINDKHMIRGVISSANRGPFTVDSYSDYTWNREGVRPMPLKMHFAGNKDQ